VVRIKPNVKYRIDIADCEQQSHSIL